MSLLIQRPRRLRANAAWRSMVAETSLSVDDLVAATDHDDTVAAQLGVKLPRVGSQLTCELEGFESVLGSVARSAAVADAERQLPQIVRPPVSAEESRKAVGHNRRPLSSKTMILSRVAAH